MNLSDKRYYKIRKEMVWVIAGVVVVWFIRSIYEYWAHVNWPPYQGSNKKFIRSLDCEKKTRERNYNVSEEILNGDETGASFHPLGLDRDLFFDHPECTAFAYLFYEGSGIRIRYSVFDMKRKMPTAHVEILFEKND